MARVMEPIHPLVGHYLLCPRALKNWGAPRWRGSCSKSTHLWATTNFVPCSKALGIPRRQGLCCQSAHLWGLLIFSPRFFSFAFHVCNTALQQKSADGTEACKPTNGRFLTKFFSS